MPVEIELFSELRAIDDGLSGDYVLLGGLGPDSTDYAAYASSGANGGDGWEPILNFTGTFHGGGHAVDGLNISRSGVDNVGLFGSVSGGTVEFVATTNCSIVGGGSTGGVVGRADSSAIVRKCHSSGTVHGSSIRVGGVVGFAFDAAVSDCFSSAAVTSASGRVGGAIGQTTSPSTADRCYATGSVSGGDDQGGLVGNDQGGSATGSFWDTETSGQGGSALGTGRTTEQMKTLATFTGASWDIVEGVNLEHVWGIDAEINGGYPFLQAFQQGGGGPSADRRSPLLSPLARPLASPV